MTDSDAVLLYERCLQAEVRASKAEMHASSLASEVLKLTTTVNDVRLLALDIQATQAADREILTRILNVVERRP